MVLVEHKFHIAALSDLCGVLQCLRIVGKQSEHLLLTLEVELLCLEFHSVGIFNQLAHLNTHQDVLHLCVLFAQVMGVIGSYQRQSGFSCHADHALVDRVLLRNAVILQL